MTDDIHGEYIKVSGFHCRTCERVITQDARFCSHCGSLQADGLFSTEDKQNYIAWLILFFAIDLVCCLFSFFLDESYSLTTMLVIDCVMLANATLFCFLLRKQIKPLLQWRSFSFAKLGLYGILAMLGSAAVQMIVNWVNSAVFDQGNYFYFLFSGTDQPGLYMILMIAVWPAIVEEFGYRGFLLAGLEKITDVKQAMYISAFLFALMHLSIISFFWLVPFAVLLSTIRQKENTIWYGVFIHFVFNATACIWELADLSF